MKNITKRNYILYLCADCNVIDIVKYFLHHLYNNEIKNASPSSLAVLLHTTYDFLADGTPIVPVRFIEKPSKNGCFIMY